MDKIIGMGNALVDVLVLIDSDEVLNDLNLPKGSMQLMRRGHYLIYVLRLRWAETSSGNWRSSS